MNHYYRLMVPTTIYNEPAPGDEVRGIVKMALAEASGGYTEYPATGDYRVESGERIEEKVFIVEDVQAENYV